MTLFLDNANDVLVSKVKYLVDKTPIDMGNFLVSICEANTSTVTAVSSHATAPVITNSESLNLQAGDRILIRRVNGTKNVNGFFDVVSIAGSDITIAADTSSQVYVEGGQIWKVLQEQEVMEVLGEAAFLKTFENTLELFPKRKYMIFIEESDLQVAIEFADSAEIRVK